MAIINTTDDGLRKLIFEHECVIVKYHSLNCPICERLVPVYENLSESEEYEGIIFVRMNANENPVAQLFVKEQTMPFTSVYKDGFLVECRTVQTERELKNILDKLKKAKGNK